MFSYCSRCVFANICKSLNLYPPKHIKECPDFVPVEWTRDELIEARDKLLERRDSTILD